MLHELNGRHQKRKLSSFEGAMEKYRDSISEKLWEEIYDQTQLIVHFAKIFSLPALIE